jgi:mRNA-degrading endonuclease RelE of RelBE toxin-antitoxin system/PHD/YefM family antitoxin component YafN of YafNO toxin-antitoxin module
MDRRLDIYDCDETVRDLVRRCEVSGERTTFERDGRPVAVLLSFDELTALRETLALAHDAQARARLDAAEDEVKADKVALWDDLFDGRRDRIRIAESAAASVRDAGEDERVRVREALEAIDDDPISGAPLFEPLRGLWTLRRGALRVVYRFVAEGRVLVVLAIERVEESR